MGRPLLQPLVVGAIVICSGGMVGMVGCSGGPSRGNQLAPPAKHPPVVMLVFDEFPTTSLVSAGGGIDPARYPNFAALSRDATWFPYATASLDETGRAMRSLLTGRTTWRYARPTYAENPRNLFSLMGRTYRIDASEEATSMCPRRLCPRVRMQNGPSIRRELASGRPERFDRWLRSLRSSARPTLYFKQVFFPHGPWRYLPSGRQLVEGSTQRRFSWEFQHTNRWLVNQRYQQHLLQVGFTDRLLGRALARLKATGLYDRALVVVTADNGESFGRIGNGHEIRRANAGDIALTPLFVKLPNQHQGRTERRHVRTIDLLPTIARSAHLKLNWRVEGRSIFGPSARRIPSSTLLVQRSGSRLRLSAGSLRRWAAAARRLKARLFGSGADPQGLFRIGPFPSMVETQVQRWPALPSDGTHAVIDLAGSYRRVRLDSGSVPVKVAGRLTGRSSRRPSSVAIGVNGVIAATAPTLTPRRGGPGYFSALLPETALRQGANEVRVFAIIRSGGRLQLRRL